MSPADDLKERPSGQFFCVVCRAVLTERDVAQGRAVRRFEETLCTNHFQEKYPGECLNHPGTEGSIECEECGGVFCENCIIELAGKKVCPQCKPAVIGEAITGKPAAIPKSLLKEAQIYSKPSPFELLFWLFMLAIVVFVILVIFLFR